MATLEVEELYYEYKQDKTYFVEVRCFQGSPISGIDFTRLVVESGYDPTDVEQIGKCKREVIFVEHKVQATSQIIRNAIKLLDDAVSKLSESTDWLDSRNPGYINDEENSQKNRLVSVG
ncbi:MAG: hypothetical protein ACRC8A_19905 [Microcoleaceae cyanobacterium]